MRPFWENLSLKDHLKDLEKWQTSFHWLVLRSADISKFCECVNESPENTNQPSASCRRCFATGRIYTDYLIKGIQYSRSRQDTGFEISTPPGILNNSSYKYAITIKDIIPKSTDLIIEVDRNKNTGEIVTPIRIVEVFDIEDVRIIYGDKGREEFYTLSVQRRSILPGTFRKDKRDY